MAKRGRPNKNGVKPGWALLRSFLVLHAYDQARARGDKHSHAIAEAVSAVRSRVPEMPISETEVKRVLAEFQSKDSGGRWIITDDIIQGTELQIWFNNLKWIAAQPIKCDIPDFPVKPSGLRTLKIQVGPRLRYPRSNARSSAARNVPRNPGTLHILPSLFGDLKANCLDPKRVLHRDAHA
jgi:hypothetical protein